MNIEELSDTIMKTGICCYGTKQYRLFLCKSTYFPGTGDYEDEPVMRYDREMACYCIWIEDMTNANNVCTGAGYYECLHDAIHAMENSPGFERWLN